MKLKAKQKIVALCAIGMITIGGVGTTFANNHDNTGFSFSFHGLNEPHYTLGRKKTDKSGCFMKCTSISDDSHYHAKVVANIEGGRHVDVSRGHVYKFVEGRKRTMTNYVYEDGYRAAAIEAHAGPHPFKTVNASGVWSPDKYHR